MELLERLRIVTLMCFAVLCMGSASAHTHTHTHIHTHTHTKFDVFLCMGPASAQPSTAHSALAVSLDPVFLFMSMGLFFCWYVPMFTSVCVLSFTVLCVFACRCPLQHNSSEPSASGTFSAANAVSSVANGGGIGCGAGSVRELAHSDSDSFNQNVNRVRGLPCNCEFN